MSDGKKIRIYYNSACPVCRAGIEFQKGKMQDCEVEWKDVHLDRKLMLEINSDLEFVRKRLHVVDENGDLQTGLDAFIAIWRNSGGEKWKSKLFGSPLLKPFCVTSYNLFAALLYSWNQKKKRW